MNSPQSLESNRVDLTALSQELGQPVVLERDGEPVAVLMSMEEYRRYQALLSRNKLLVASEARRAADRAVFGDLVGCALSSGEPIWSPMPQPHWRVPYRFFDGKLAQIIDVDARTGAVSLTAADRAELLARVERRSAADVAA